MIKDSNRRITITIPADIDDVVNNACEKAKVSKSKFILALIHSWIYQVNEYIKASKKGE